MNHDPRLLTRALNDAKRAVALNDQLAPSRVILAEVHDEGGNPDLAIQEYQRALALDPRKVIDLTPDNAGAYTNLAVMLKSLNDEQGSRQAYEKSISIAPSYAAYSEPDCTEHHELHLRLSSQLVSDPPPDVVIEN